MIRLDPTQGLPKPPGAGIFEQALEIILRNFKQYTRFASADQERGLLE